MNFNNWYQTIYNNVKLKLDCDIALWNFGPTGVVRKENLLGIGAIELEDQEHSRRNKIPEIIAMDCEPNTSTDPIMSAFLLDHRYTDSNYRPYRIYAVSDKNNKVIDGLIDTCRHHGDKTPAYNWYYFAHAFIALDWYREYKFYNDADLIVNKTFKYDFITMNRLVDGPRNYRLILLSRLEELGVTVNALVSYSKYTEDGRPLPPAIKNRIIQYCAEPKRFDISGDRITNDSMHINVNSHLSSFFNLVTETCFYESFNHLTEKIFRPIAMLQPFVLASTPNSLEYLKGYGFKTFDRWIDESYDKIINPIKRLDAIADVMQYICSLSEGQKRTMFNEMLPTLQHNRQHFYNNLYDIAHKEMWDNFDYIVSDTQKG